MKNKTFFKVKDWLKERSSKSQFKFMPKPSHESVHVVLRLKDGIYFLEGQTVKLLKWHKEGLHLAHCKITAFKGDEKNLLLQVKEGRLAGLNLQAPINDVEHI